MAEVYKKIEKKVLELKEKEDFWKKKYLEIARQNKELVESNSKQIKSSQLSLRRLEHRTKLMEDSLASQSAKVGENLTSYDKKIASVSEAAKSISFRLEEKEKEMKTLKTEIASTVNGMISKHERVFDVVLEKIGKASKGIQEGLDREKGIYERMESTKRFMENYKPPASPSVPSPPAPQRETRIPLLYEEMPEAPRPARRTGLQPSRLNLGEFQAPEEEDFGDDGPDVEDVIKGRFKAFGSSADSMSANASNIDQKLAAIEEKVSKMQAGKSEGVERIEDKLQVYRESVNEMKKRMESIERAMKDGMVPMMESMSTLVEAVKEIKQNQSKPSVQKPSPPKNWKEGSETPFKLVAGKSSLIVKR